MLRKSVSEIIGTFALVFCGTGAIIIDNVTKGGVSHAGVAVTFGLIVMAMIYCLGDISGAHLNPAVSIAFTLAGRLPVKALGIYIVSEVTSAFLASIVLKFLFPMDELLGTTLPAGSAWQSFVLELLLTFFLMLVNMTLKKPPWQWGEAPYPAHMRKPCEKPNDYDQWRLYRGPIKQTPGKRGFVLRLTRVIYLWQQPGGHAGQCGGQGQGSVHADAQRRARSIITNMMNDLYVNKCFGPNYEKRTVLGGFQ